MEGRKRHLLVDTEGLVLEARVHSANKVPDQDGIRLLSLLDPARDRAPWAPFSAVGRCSGYQGRGRRWAEEALGLSVEVVVRKPTKLVPEKVAKAWAQSSGPRRVRRLSGRGSCHLGACGSWVVGGLWSENLRVDLCHNRRMAKDYERLLRHRRGFRLRGDDAAHGERVGPSVRVSRQSF